MGEFTIIDGFADRGVFYDGYSWDYRETGFGLYRELEGSYDEPPWGWINYTQKVGRYGDYCAILPDPDMYYYGISLTGPWPLPAHKEWSGGVAINSTNVYTILSCGAGYHKGPNIVVNAEGGIYIEREEEFSGHNVSIAVSEKQAIITNWNWHYVSWKFHCGDRNNDWIQVWIDGDLVIDIDHVTLNFVGEVEWIDFYFANAIDDIWIRNDANMIPEPRIPAIFPSGNGDDSDGTPVGESTNYEAVNSFMQDHVDGEGYGDPPVATGVMEGSWNVISLNEKDSFEMGKLSEQISAGTVHALVARFLCMSEVGNTDQLRPYVIVDGNKYNGTAQSPTSDAYYEYIQHIWETNPDTSLPWTVADIDAVQIGYEVV